MGNGTTVISLGSDYDAARALALEAAIARIDGVESVEFNYTNNKVTVRFDPDQVNQEELKGLVMRERKRRARSVKELQSSEVGWELQRRRGKRVLTK